MLEEGGVFAPQRQKIQKTRELVERRKTRRRRKGEFTYREKSFLRCPSTQTDAEADGGKLAESRRKREIRQYVSREDRHEENKD